MSSAPPSVDEVLEPQGSNTGTVDRSVDDYSSHDTPPKRLGLALVLICAAQLMIVLDSTIVNIAMPHLQRDLAISDASLPWVITIYTLAFGGVLLLGGRLGDLYGRRKLFVMGVVLFTLASVAGGVAQNEATMLIARAAQGLGGALAAPNALALITTTFPAGKERNRAMGVFAAMSGAGAAIGLILGGALTEIDWRWNFFINLPIGLVVALLAPRLLSESEPGHGALDIPGAVTSVAGLSALVYGLTHAAQTEWSDSVTIGSLVAGAVLLVAFVLIERRTAHPLLPMRIPANRTRGISYFVMLLVGAAMFGMFFYLGIYIQNTLGYSSIKAGLAFLPFSFALVAAAQVASSLMTKVDPRWTSGVGAVLASAGMWRFTSLDASSSYAGDLLPWMVMIAFGMGLIFVPLTLTAVHGVEHEDSSVASAVLNTTQQVGGTIGLAAFTTVFVSTMNDRIAELTAGAPVPPAGHVPTPEELAAQQAVLADAWTEGASSAYLVAAVMMAIAAVVTFAFLTIRHQELAHDGAEPVHIG